MNKIYELRTKLEMTQDEFAEYCGVSRISIARYEAGTQISRSNAKKISKACGVSLDFLLDDSSDPESEKEQTPAVVSADPWDVETAFSDPQDDSIRIMARGMGRLSPENRQKLLDVAKTLFSEDFDEEGNKK